MESNRNIQSETNLKKKKKLAWQCFRVVLCNCLQCQGHSHCILLFIMLPELILGNNYPALLFDWCYLVPVGEWMGMTIAFVY